MWAAHKRGDGEEQGLPLVRPGTANAAAGGASGVAATGLRAYFISDVVEELDLSVVMARYQREGRGGPPYHPRRKSRKAGQGRG